MQQKNVLILKACCQDASEQFSAILESNFNLVIKTIEVPEVVSKLIQDWRPNLILVIGDQARFANEIAAQQLSAVPKILVSCCSKNKSNLSKLPVDGFDEFIMRPFHKAEIIYRIQCLLGELNREEVNITKKNLLSKLGLEQIIGQDPAFLKLLSKIPLIADSSATILITGETGVGKEVCARAVHYLSERTDKPFVPLNCGALPANLIENELFGHKKGAFTDARTNQLGLIAEAEEGTLFLDEINSLPLESQSKLLRLLQDKTYRPLGHAKNVRANIRVLAATNVDLSQKVEDGEFRKDLFYRLTINLEIPPLRGRKSDIPLLANHLLKKFAQEDGKNPKTFSPAALQKLFFYDWPGNIRELENVIQHAILLSPTSVISPEYIHLPNPSQDCTLEKVSFVEAKKNAIEKFEHEYIKDLLITFGGNISRAAKAAKKDRSDFSKLVKKYQLQMGSVD